MYIGGVKMNLKVGDMVSVKRAFASHEGSHDLFWAAEMDECVGKKLKVKSICAEGYVQLDGGWWFYPFVLEKVDDRPKAAHILTEKVMVGDTPCRKIVGFEGIGRRDELPKKYVVGTPAFWYHQGRSGAHVFDGTSMGWERPDGSGIGLDMHLPACVRIDVGCYMFTGMNVGDVWPEPTFQELLTWLKRAGSRLAKIRKQEKVAWAGEETVEI